MDCDEEGDEEILQIEFDNLGVVDGREERENIEEEEDDGNQVSKRRKRTLHPQDTTILLPPDEALIPLGNVVPPLKDEVLEHLGELFKETDKIHKMYAKIIGTLRRPLTRSLLGCLTDVQKYHHSGEAPKRTEDYENMAIPFAALLFIIEKVEMAVKKRTLEDIPTNRLKCYTYNKLCYFIN